MKESGEWLGVTGAARSPRYCWWQARASGWRQARPDAVGAFSYEVVGPKEPGTVGYVNGSVTECTRSGAGDMTDALRFCDVDLSTGFVDIGSLGSAIQGASQERGVDTP
jgi:hypothetical protein